MTGPNVPHEAEKVLVEVVSGVAEVPGASVGLGETLTGETADQGINSARGDARLAQSSLRIDVSDVVLHQDSLGVVVPIGRYGVSRLFDG